MIAPLLTAMLLGGCAHSGSVPPPSGAPQLPPVPADIKACLAAGLVEIPDRDLTREDVERLWGTERARSAAKSRCGARLVNRDEKLRKDWR